MTAIEWTDETWNCVTGCDQVSPGCDNCYALTMAKRLKAMGQPKYQNDGDPRTSGPGFRVTCHPQELSRPLSWKKPRRVFVNSMSDLFHPDVPDSFIYDVFASMGLASQHTFQVLTKRPQRMASLLGQVDIAPLIGDRTVRGDGSYGLTYDAFVSSAEGDHLPNVWLGTSIESNRYVFRADHLRRTPAAVRFLSLEPLLGPLPDLDLTGIDWVIVGGESGKSARPMHPDWVRDIRDRCVDQGVSFFFKQWGAWTEDEPDDIRLQRQTKLINAAGEFINHHEDGDCHVWRVGKKRAGRLLDGGTWDEMPDRMRAAA